MAVDVTSSEVLYCDCDSKSLYLVSSPLHESCTAKQYAVLRSTVKYYKVLQSTTPYYKVLLCTTEYNDNAAAHPKT